MLMPLVVAAVVSVTALPAGAAQLLPPERPSAKVLAKVLKDKSTPVAARDVDETGSIQTGQTDTSSCERSRKRLFVEGEGWIVRKVTTCY